MDNKYYNMDARPLYTTISVDYLDSLMKSKFILDSITKGVVSERHLEYIIRSLMKAKAKHKDFCSKITYHEDEESHENVKGTLSNIRSWNDEDEKEGKANAMSILSEEKFEAIEKYLEKDLEGFRDELGDMAAVIVRMMEFADREEGSKK